MAAASTATLKAEPARGNEKNRRGPGAPPASHGQGVGAAAPRIAGKRGGHRITLEGGLYTLLAILIGLAALNTGANLLYFVLALMLALLILNAHLARRNLRRLKLERVLPLEFHAGETVQGHLRLINQKAFYHSYAVRVHDLITGPVDFEGKPAGDQVSIRLGSYAFEVPARQSTLLPVQFKLPARGVYVLSEARLVSRFPFGFFEKHRRWIEPGKLLVYPGLLPLLEVLQHVSRALGDLVDERKGQGSSLYGVRDYQAGDPSRLIHWGLSAKGQGLKIKEFEQEESRAYMLMLDLRCPAEVSPALRADFEKAISLCATLARYLLQREAQVGLWTTIGNIPPEQGRRHLQRILRALAQVQPLPPDTPLRHPEAHSHMATQLWLDFQAPDNRGARAGSVIRRGPTSHIIDVRKIIIDHPNAAEAATL